MPHTLTFGSDQADWNLSSKVKTISLSETLSSWVKLKKKMDSTTNRLIPKPTKPVNRSDVSCLGKEIGSKHKKQNKVAHTIFPFSLFAKTSGRSAPNVSRAYGVRSLNYSLKKE